MFARRHLLLPLLLLVTVLLVEGKRKDETEAKGPRRYKRTVFAVGGLFTGGMTLMSYGLKAAGVVRSWGKGQKLDQLSEQITEGFGQFRSELANVRLSISELERTVARQHNQLAHLINFRGSVDAKDESIYRLHEIAEDFQRLNDSRDSFDEDMDRWTSACLHEDGGGPRSCKGVLRRVHNLVTGNKLTVSRPLFNQYFDTFTDNEWQSRVWKTEAYADLFLLKQAEVCSLWLVALSYANVTYLNTRLADAKQLCDSQRATQLELILGIRDMNSTYDYVVSGPVLPGVSSICTAMTPCLSPGYSLNSSGVGRAAGLVTKCRDKSVVANVSRCQRDSRMIDRLPLVFRQRRMFSAQLISVADPVSETICSLNFWEELVGRQIFIRLNATVCLKPTHPNSDSRVRVVGYPLFSGDEQLTPVMWPYKIAQPFIPRDDGWVTAVGLDLLDKSALRVVLRTDYFWRNI